MAAGPSKFDRDPRRLYNH